MPATKTPKPKQRLGQEKPLRIRYAEVIRLRRIINQITRPIKPGPDER